MCMSVSSGEHQQTNGNGLVLVAQVSFQLMPGIAVQTELIINLKVSDASMSAVASR